MYRKQTYNLEKCPSAFLNMFLLTVILHLLPLTCSHIHLQRDMSGKCEAGSENDMEIYKSFD